MSQSKQFILAELFKREKTKSLCVCCVVLQEMMLMASQSGASETRSFHTLMCITPPNCIDYPNLFCWAAAAGGPVDSHVTFDPKELERVGCVCTQCS
jgi:hypothetical protein